MEKSNSNTPVAQLAEQRIPNPQVAGSSPSRRDSANGSGGNGADDVSTGGSDGHGGVIYKGGQGYWVRMMTAVLAGVMVTAIAGWLWQQMAVVPLPTPRWALTVDNLERAPLPGTTVEVEHESAAGLENIGRVVIDPKQSGGGQLVVGGLALVEDRSMTEASRLKGTGSDGKEWSARVTAPRAIPIVEPIYVQAGAASLVLVIGAFVIFRYVALKAGSVEFLIATDAEMKKVNWSTRKMVLDSTWVVVGACVLLVTILFLLDVGLSRLFHALDVLQT